MIVIGKRARLPLQASIALTTGLLSDSAVGSYMSAQIPAGLRCHFHPD